MIRRTLVFFAFFAFCFGQNVIYTDVFIKIHAVKDMSHLVDYKRGLDYYKKLLQTDYSDEILLNKQQQCYELVLELSPKDQDIDELIRHIINKRGFEFLGNILHELTDVVGPDQWEGQLRINRDLFKITKDERALRPRF